MILRLGQLFLIAIFITACEAPLVLTGVEEAKASTIHRTDRIQAAASKADSILVVGIGFILNSSDTGKTWSRTSPKSFPAFIGAAICPNKLQVAVSAEKTLWSSLDNGKTWQSQKLDTEEAPQHISCSPDNKIWIANSYSTLLSSSDNGQSWHKTEFEEDLFFTYLQFFDALNGVLIGEFGTVYSTVDGGLNWLQKEQPIPNDFYPMAASFLNINNGWVAGSSGVILHTTDGGSTWTKERTGSEAPLYGLSASSLGVYATGDFGTFLERQEAANGTATWLTSDAVSARFYLRAITPINDNKMLIGGGAGTLKVLVNNGNEQLVAVNSQNEASQ